MTSGPGLGEVLGRMDRDVRARREPAVLVRVAIHEVVEEVVPDPAVREQRVRLARRAVAGDPGSAPLLLDEKCEEVALR